MEDGSDPKLLDLIQIPIDEACPTPVQPENVFVGDGQWNFIEHLEDSDARSLLDDIRREDTELFGDASHYIEAEYLRKNPAEYSLEVVRPEEVAWLHGTSAFGALQVRGNFTLGDIYYDLPMTDPAFRPESGSRDQSPYLTISLGEEFVETGRCYKILAGVILL